jgi:hypothetical protein
LNRYAEEVLHFANVAFQKEPEADDGDLTTSNIVLESLSGRFSKTLKRLLLLLLRSSQKKIQTKTSMRRSRLFGTQTGERSVRLRLRPPGLRSLLKQYRDQLWLERPRSKLEVSRRKRTRRTFRRLDSANPNEDAQYEEFELATSRFAPLGTAQSVEWVDAK